MPWQSGHYYLFSKLLIVNAVPCESGVFGLYNIQNRIFIGESGNLRAALLRLYDNMQRFGFNLPAGFTFELCQARSRVARVKELLADYDLESKAGCPNIVLYG
ncbi:MAG: hypothetical protein GEU77_14935 [Deltaproteobacteria bacterium]|nr:hypothetical protein [Deltaproteobacteria bacterium]